MVNRKLGNVGNVRICFPSFPLPSFRFGVLGQNRKVGREKAAKNYPRFPTFARFPSFRSGRLKIYPRKGAANNLIKWVQEHMFLQFMQIFST